MEQIIHLFLILIIISFSLCTFQPPFSYPTTPLKYYSFLSKIYFYFSNTLLYSLIIYDMVCKIISFLLPIHFCLTLPTFIITSSSSIIGIVFQSSQLHSSLIIIRISLMKRLKIQIQFFSLSFNLSLYIFVLIWI